MVLNQVRRHSTRNACRSGCGGITTLPPFGAVPNCQANTVSTHAKPLLASAFWRTPESMLAVDPGVRRGDGRKGKWCKKLITFQSGGEGTRSNGKRPLHPKEMAGSKPGHDESYVIASAYFPSFASSASSSGTAVNRSATRP